MGEKDIIKQPKTFTISETEDDDSDHGGDDDDDNDDDDCDGDEIMLLMMIIMMAAGSNADGDTQVRQSCSEIFEIDSFISWAPKLNFHLLVLTICTGNHMVSSAIWNK